MDERMENLSSILSSMAVLSEKSVATSIDAYIVGKNVSEDIRAWSDELRRNEEEVSEIALELIARYQPVASDLRFIKASMEIAYGFSRFGRYALDIIEVLEMFGDQSACDHTTVELTGKTTKEMIRMSIDAFTNRDEELAKNIQKLDDYVDEKYRTHVAKIINDPAPKKCDISAILILRYLERISDHSSYIGESVVFIVTGQKFARR
jgi:phosphate transport system protein